MKTSPAGIWAAILMLSAIIVLLRALYLYAPRRWQPRGVVARPLRYAPMAAIVAVALTGCPPRCPSPAHRPNPAWPAAAIVHST